MKGWRRSGRIATMLAMAAVPGMTVAGQSNTAAPQTIPGVGNFSLPPLHPTPHPVPSAAPTLTPDPTPTFTRVTPTPRPTPTPSPTATARPARPTRAAPAPARRAPVRATPPRRPVSSPAPTPAASPIAAASPSPIPTPTVSPTPDVSTPPTPVATAVAPMPSDRDDQSWIALAAIAAGVFALVGLAFLLLKGSGRRRGKTPEALSLAPAPAAPSPPPPGPGPAPAPDPAPRATARTQRDDGPPVEIELTPRRAGTNMTGAAIDYQITLRNAGSVEARDIRVAIYMLSASARQAAELQSLFAEPVAAGTIAPFVLAPGADMHLTGMALLDRERVNVMSIDGKPWFVPVLAIKADYRWGENVGAPGVAATAYMIGIDRGEGVKMAPFRLDTGPLMHSTVSARRVA